MAYIATPLLVVMAVVIALFYLVIFGKPTKDIQ